MDGSHGICGLYVVHIAQRNQNKFSFVINVLTLVPSKIERCEPACTAEGRRCLACKGAHHRSASVPSCRFSRNPSKQDRPSSPRERHGYHEQAVRRCSNSFGSGRWLSHVKNLLSTEARQCSCEQCASVLIFPSSQIITAINRPPILTEFSPAQQGPVLAEGARVPIESRLRV